LCCTAKERDYNDCSSDFKLYLPDTAERIVAGVFCTQNSNLQKQVTATYGHLFQPQPTAAATMPAKAH